MASTFEVLPINPPAGLKLVHLNPDADPAADRAAPVDALCFERIACMGIEVVANVPLGGRNRWGLPAGGRIYEDVRKLYCGQL